MRKVKAFLLRSLTKKSPRTVNHNAFVSFVFLRYDRIGDLIVSLPLVKALRERFPEVRFTLLGSAANSPIAVQSELFDEVIVRPSRSWLRWIAILVGLRRKKISVVFDLNHSVAPHTIYACLLINARHVASPFKDGRWGIKGDEMQLFDIMPRRHPRGYDRPISEIYLDIAKEMGCNPKYPYPYPLEPNMAVRECHPHVILNHKGSKESMRLRDDDIISIVDLVAEIQPKYKVIMVPETSEYRRICELTKNQTNVYVMEPSPTIIPIIKVVKTAMIVVTPDTSIVHIACAYSKKLIAIYTSDQTLFEQWRPMLSLPSAKVIQSNSPKSIEDYSTDELLQAISTTLRNA